MSYQVLARKWRPQSFDELVGQEPIVTALQNALRDGRVAQAYLFSGIRGVGKTTAARLLAKALNQGDDPAVAAGESRDITSSADMDVIEVDAATYSKVEQVRELTESLQYKPAGRRYKVVIIDEIHRLSRQAFDALLKIVEEPPPHLVFIFATTEIEAVPATVLSRCQEFHFRRVPAEVLVGHLRAISEAESITVSDTALRLIARAGEGSVRDSVALLDQLATFGGGEITDEDAVRLLGGLDTALFQRLLEAQLEGQPRAVCEIVREVEDHGWDPRGVFAQYLAFCRDALHLALGAEGEQIDLPADQVEQLRQLGRKAGYENLLRLLNQLLQSETAVRRSEAGGLALEIAWLRAAELPRLVGVERVLAGAPAPPSSSTSSSSSGSTPRSSGGRSSRSAAGSSAKSARASSAPDEPAEPAERDAVTPAPASDREARAETAAEDERTESAERSALDPRRTVTELRRRVAAERQPLAAHLDSTRLRIEDGRLVVSVPEGDVLIAEALARPKNRELVERLLDELGLERSWRLEQHATESAEPERLARSGDASDRADDAKAEIDDPVVENKTVQAVLEIFGGAVESVEHRPPAPPDTTDTDRLASEETT